MWVLALPFVVAFVTAFLVAVGWHKTKREMREAGEAGEDISLMGLLAFAMTAWLLDVRRRRE